MLRAHHIQELLGRSGSGIVLRDSGDGYLTWRTTIDGIVFTFEADTVPADDESHFAEISFERQIHPGLGTITQVPSAQGTALRVFSAAIAFTKAVMMHLGWVSQMAFNASTAEPSRVKMYRTLAEIVARRTSGQLRISQHGNSIRFEITQMRRV